MHGKLFIFSMSTGLLAQLSIQIGFWKPTFLWIWDSVGQRLEKQKRKKNSSTDSTVIQQRCRAGKVPALNRWSFGFSGPTSGFKYHSEAWELPAKYVCKWAPESRFQVLSWEKLHCDKCKVPRRGWAPYAKIQSCTLIYNKMTGTPVIQPSDKP